MDKRTVKIEFDVENAAFEEGGYDEVIRVVNSALVLMERGEGEYPLYDVNGNKVGLAVMPELEEDEDEDE